MPDSSSRELRRSFRGRTWRQLAPNPRLAGMLEAAGAGSASFVLAARAMNPAEAPSFVRPRILDLLPSPWFFNDMEAAADRIVAAIRAEEKIAVWGDYDVDGATSSAIVRRYLRECGSEASIYVPDRVLEGYGPNAEGLRMLREEGIDLVIVVDSGTVAFEALAAAKACGLDIVVLDHHAPEESLPDARAIVNPNRKDQAAGYGQLCAAGVAFVLLKALEIKLSSIGFFEQRRAPDLMSFADLVALGTVCDVVPLTGLNRAFVAEGLRMTSRRDNLGLRALCQASGLFRDHQAWDLGFVLGPRINAGGRIGQSTAGARLLFSEDEAECMELAKALDKWNRDRQEIERQCVEEAKSAIEGRGGANGFAIAASPNWHEGVVGIVASRLKDFYDVPSFCFAVIGDRAKGSGRGVPGFHLGNAVIEAKKLGLLTRGGGHAMAAGVSCDIGKLGAFANFMRDQVKRSGFLEVGIVTTIDAEIAPVQATVGLADAMGVIEPYGQGNPAPRFLIRGLDVLRVGIVKEHHLKVELAGAEGARLEAPMFSGLGTPFGEAMRDAVGRKVDIVASLKVDEWKGDRKVRLQLEDARWAV